mmetsp:Transcript_11960/g.25296  ORF Transcript_11960/g.25296 Transcript_11960/m.25296 type:complete len:84 (+) Transcript_11960:112-363(+)
MTMDLSVQTIASNNYYSNTSTNGYPRIAYPQQKDRISLMNHRCYDNNNRSDFLCPVLDDDNSLEAMLMLLVWTLSAAIICCSF